MRPISGANRSAVGVKISAKLGTLAGSLVTTASATCARLGLGFVEAKILLEAGKGPMTKSMIARAVGMDRSAVSRAVKLLVARGLLVPAGGRAACLRLTPAGVSHRALVEAVFAAREQRLLAGLTPTERAVIGAYLERLSVNVPALAKLAQELQAAGNLCVPNATNLRHPAAR